MISKRTLKIEVEVCTIDSIPLNSLPDTEKSERIHARCRVRLGRDGSRLTLLAAWKRGLLGPSASSGRK